MNDYMDRFMAWYEEKERSKADTGRPTFDRDLVPTNEQGPRYGDAALRSELNRVAHEVEGHRNVALNEGAFRMGQLLASGALGDENHVFRALVGAAIKSGLGSDEAERTVRSGLTGGKAQPR